MLPLGYLFAPCLLLHLPLTVCPSFSASTLFPDCSCTLQCICVTVLLLFFHQLLSWVTSCIYLPPCGSSLVILPLCCCFWAPVSLFWMEILYERAVCKHLHCLSVHSGSHVQPEVSSSPPQGTWVPEALWSGTVGMLR